MLWYLCYRCGSQRLSTTSQDPRLFTGSASKLKARPPFSSILCIPFLECFSCKLLCLRLPAFWGGNVVGFIFLWLTTMHALLQLLSMPSLLLVVKTWTTKKKKRGWKLFKYLGSYCNCTCASNIIGSLCTSISETCNSFDWFATSVNDFLALVVVTLSSHKFQAFEWQHLWDYVWLLDWLSVPRYVDFWLLNFMCCCLLKVVPMLLLKRYRSDCMNSGTWVAGCPLCDVCA